MGAYTTNCKKLHKAKNNKSAKIFNHMQAKLEEEGTIFLAQNKKILNLAIQLYNLNIQEINQKLPQILIESNIAVKEIIKEDDAQIIESLSKIGDVSIMMKEYEKEQKAIETPKQKNSSKKYSAQFPKARNLCISYIIL